MRTKLHTIYIECVCVRAFIFYIPFIFADYITLSNNRVTIIFKYLYYIHTKRLHNIFVHNSREYNPLLYFEFQLFGYRIRQAVVNSFVFIFYEKYSKRYLALRMIRQISISTAKNANGTNNDMNRMTYDNMVVFDRLVVT